MKKVVRMLGLCALVALAITSCKKNEEQSKQLTFTATISQPVSGDRTHIGPDNVLVWDAGNSIKVFNANGEVDDCTTSTGGDKVATFTGTLTPTDTYTAFYPNATVVGDNVKINLSANQNYVNNNFGNDTYPMYATGVTEGQNINFMFHSHASVLRINLKSANACTVGSIIVTGGANDVLAGDLVYAYSNPTACTVENGTNQVTLTCPDGVALTNDEAGTPFNIVLKSGTLSTGTTVVVKDRGGNVITTLTTSQNNTLRDEYILDMQPVQNVVYNLPTVTTTAATNVTYTAANLNGEYTEVAGAAVTSCGFYFSENEADVQNKVASAKVSCASVGSPMSYPVSGLTAGTTYYFRAWAANSTGENCGQVLSFTTPVQVVAPSVTTVGHEITGTSATLSGSLTNDGNAACTVGFYYGTDPTLASHQTKTLSGTHNSVYNFTWNWGGLSFNTDYYYQAFATNSNGTVTGQIKTFKIDFFGRFLVDETNQRFVTFSTGLLWWDNDAQEFAFEDDQYSFHKWQDGESGTPNASFSQFCWSHPYDDYGKNNTRNQVGGEFQDWGQNVIRKSNTTDEYYPANYWRTLTYDEWECIRVNHDHLRREVNGVYYFVLLPYGLTASQAGSYNNQQLSDLGAAFFPMCGNAQNDPNLEPSSWGYNSQICLWTSTMKPNDYGSAGAVWLYWDNGGYINAGGLSNSYYHRMQVRLARDFE